MSSPEAKPDESGLIARYFAPIATAPGALGLTDDAAFLTPPDGSDLVLTKDALVANVHFFADDPPDSIARKALRVNLSDLAAKGAAPLGFLLALALPADWRPDWLAAFSEGLADDARTYAIPLLGGDTVRASEVMVSITAFGSVPHGAMVRRDGARPGDRIYVSGTIGDAALGLTLRQGTLDLPAAHAAHLADRYLLPRPRMALAPVLRARASAAMDISDGLAGDLAKLLAASGAIGRVDVARVPLSDAASAVLSAMPGLIETVLAGGDDYEILCTVPASSCTAFEAAARDAGIAVAAIGEVMAGQGPPLFLLPDGQTLRLSRASFSHF